ncbi:ATP-binding protein [Thermodesulfobacteriota bacterium]
MDPNRTYVIINILDTGPSISQGEVNYIFDPFFPTKSKGTGLGLAVSYGIVKGR